MCRFETQLEATLRCVALAWQAARINRCRPRPPTPLPPNLSLRIANFSATSLRRVKLLLLLLLRVSVVRVWFCSYFVFVGVATQARS